MDESKPSRWWRNTPWRVAVALWLILPVLYPLSAAPTHYALARGWFGKPGSSRYGASAEMMIRFYAPGLDACCAPPLKWTPLGQWWVDTVMGESFGAGLRDWDAALNQRSPK